MARLYKEKPGELHIYRNRKPRRNGGDASSVFLWLWGLMALIFASALWIDMASLPSGREVGIGHLLFNAAFLLYFMGLLAWSFERVVFSQKDGGACRSLFFLRWGRIPFTELGEITLKTQEMFGKPRYLYQMCHRNEFHPPLRLSPWTRSLTRLSRYYHDIMPRLSALLEASRGSANEEDILEIAVETVEVPVHLANQAIIHDHTGFPEPQTDEAPAPSVVQGQSFKRKGTGFATSLWMVNGVMAAVGVAFMICMAWLVHLFTGTITIPLLIAVVNIAIFAYNLARENMDLVIHRRERTVSFRDMFGLRRKRYSYDDIRSFTMKSMFGLHTLCVEIDGQAVDPSIAISRSPAKIRDSYRECCAILEFDPRRYWKA